MMFNTEYSIAAASIEQAQRVASQRGLVVVPAPVREANVIDGAILLWLQGRTIYVTNCEQRGVAAKRLQDKKPQ